jgi:hypothetical protein
VKAAVESVRVAAAPGSGRWEVQGGAPPGPEAAALYGLPDAAAARARLESAVAAANDDLSLVADRVGGRIELFPEEGVTGLRVSGLIVPFYDNDAGRLAAVRDRGRQRPVEALTNVAEILDARLSEPQTLTGLDDTIRNRDLTRLARDVRDALDESALRTRTAAERFRRETADAARRAGGPFHRRGRMRVAEIALAAVLAAALRAAARGRRSTEAPPLALTLSAAAAVAVAAVLLVEGTDLLPVDPVTGTALRFLPLAAAIGFLTAAGLEREWNGGDGEGSGRRGSEPPAATQPERPVPAAAASEAKGPAPRTERRPNLAPPSSERELPEETEARPPRGSDLPPDRLPFFRRRSRR